MTPHPVTRGEWNAPSPGPLAGTRGGRGEPWGRPVAVPGRWGLLSGTAELSLGGPGGGGGVRWVAGGCWRPTGGGTLVGAVAARRPGQRRSGGEGGRARRAAGPRRGGGSLPGCSSLFFCRGDSSRPLVSWSA